MADRHPAWDQIEPEAQGLARHHDIIPGEHAIELSKAISLKRIADALDSDALNFNSIIDLFWQAGQAFERGRGTA